MSRELTCYELQIYKAKRDIICHESGITIYKGEELLLDKVSPSTGNYSLLRITTVNLRTVIQRIEWVDNKLLKRIK